jgi:hypothetical protein
MLIIFKMTGILVSAVLTTLALLFGFWYLYHKGRLPIRLLNKLREYSDDAYYGRPHAYPKVYSHYITKCPSIALKWIQTLHVKVDHPSNSSSHKCYEAASNGFIQLRHFLIQINTIVHKLRRRVNQNGKKPSSLTNRLFLAILRWFIPNSKPINRRYFIWSSLAKIYMS